MLWTHLKTVFSQNLSPSNNVNLEVLSCIIIVTAHWRSVPGDKIDFFDLSADGEISYSLKTSEPATWQGMPEGKVPQNTWAICIATLNHWSIWSYLHVKSFRGKTKQGWLQDFRNTTARQRWDIFSFLPMHLPLTYFTVAHGFKTLFFEAGIYKIIF